MRIINLIGYSGSGKTYFITTATMLLKKRYNYNISVIKNVHLHPIDQEGKDSHKYIESGASASIIKNQMNQSAIFLHDGYDVAGLITILENLPLKTDILFIEGFRSLAFPSLLCVKKLEEIKQQYNEYVKAISGKLFVKDLKSVNYDLLPVINIERDFDLFCELFL
jgi:molybdopterin-guanine dinucleotide biosynthesis protein MobB